MCVIRVGLSELLEEDAGGFHEAQSKTLRFNFNKQSDSRTGL